MQSIRDSVANDTENFGIEVVDIRIGRSELPEAVSQTVYNRMVTERQRQASQLRAEGAENARRITAEADRQKVVIVAEAQREAQVLRGEGDATRNAILGESYGRIPISSNSSVRSKPIKRPSRGKAPPWCCRRTATSSSISEIWKVAEIGS